MTMTVIDSTTEKSAGGRALPLASVALATFWTGFGAHDWGEIAVSAGVIVLTAALVFGAAAPRARRSGTQGGWSLGLGIAAVLLTLPAFWSGLPMVLGAAAIALGSEARNRDRGADRAIAGLVLGTVAVLGYLAIYVADGVVLGHAGFLFD